MTTRRGYGRCTIRSGPTSGSRDASSSRRTLSIDRAWFSSAGSSSTASTTVSARDEARDVVDVPVRVVADAAFAEPDRLPRAEPLAKGLLVALARQPGISDLHVAQQPLLGDEQQAGAVGLDAAAFEHDRRAGVRARRLDARQRRDRRRWRGRPARRRRQLAYFAHALNAQLSSVTAPDGSTTPVGALSRSQTRSVGTRCRRT